MDFKSSILPTDLSNCIGIICNGEFQVTDHIKERVKQCSSLIGVDGGLYHCKKIDCKPQWIVGDFDSVNQEIYEEFSSQAGAKSLIRAKDSTDLEEAITKAKEISHLAQIIIWGGLGGRLDHSLANIFLILREAGKIFLETEEQLVFALNHSLGEIKIKQGDYQSFALIPLYGSSKNVKIKFGSKSTCFPVINKNTMEQFPIDGDVEIAIEQGELIAVLDKRKISSLAGYNFENEEVNFSIGNSLVKIFSHLFWLSNKYEDRELRSKEETVVHLQPASSPKSFKRTIGQTISLVPFYGPVKGIQTNGLKWNYNSNTLTELNKFFVGISNVTMENNFSIKLEEGELLCIINENLIDLEMVDLTKAK